MPQVEIVVREVGRTKPEFSLSFSLPEIPKVGDYISIRRIDVREPLGEDIIVRHVWWRLNHTGEPLSSGGVTEIFVECDKAIGPHSTSSWKKFLEAKIHGGAEVEVFDVCRMPTSSLDDE